MANKQSSKDLRKVRRQLEEFMNDSWTGRVEVCLPKSLTREFLIEHTPVNIIVGEWTEFVRYIVSRVVIATLNEDYKRRGRAGKWVSLPTDAFKDLAPSKYKVMRTALLDLGVLECDDKYSRERRETYGYRLGKAFGNQPIKFRHLHKSKVLLKLLKRNRDELEQQKERISAIAHVAKGWLDYDSIHIDKERAQEFLQGYHDELLKQVQSLDAKGVELEQHVVWVRNQYLYAKQQVERWGERPSLSVDDKGGRFYHPLVGLMSPLRNFVTYKGAYLVSFDLKNSQPLHLLMVLTKAFWQDNSRRTWSLQKLDEEAWLSTQKAVEELRERVRNSPPIELQNPSQHTDEEHDDVTHFTDLVLNGKLYEFMVEHFQEKFLTSKGSDRFGTRELAKREMLRLMYFNSNNPHSDAQPPFAEFRRLFPRVASLMDVLKQRDYADFPVLLQKLEAHMMLQKVSRQIYDRKPGAWFTTIHDSVITMPEHAVLVQEVIRTTYEEVLGATPAIERTDLHPDAAFHGLLGYVHRKINKHIGGEAHEPQGDHQQLDTWIRAQFVGVDASLAYPFSDFLDSSTTSNPFADAEEYS